MKLATITDWKTLIEPKTSVRLTNRLHPDAPGTDVSRIFNTIVEIRDPTNNPIDKKKGVNPVP
ncbi:hypothetical protein D3C81_2189730 [compost metagenome]